MREMIPTTRDLVAAAVAAGLVVGLWGSGALRALDRPAADLLVRCAHRPVPAAVPVAVVAIDDDAVAAEGALPWPRERLARLVTAAQGAGAKAVVLDILVPDPGDEAGDRALALALDGLPTVLAAALERPGRWLLPLERFGGAAHAAHSHAEIGPDGVVRTLASSKQADGVALPALAVAAARHLGWLTALAPGAPLHLDFVPSPFAIPTAGASELLAGRVPAELLAGRVVFIGVTATGATDQLIVPIARSTPAPGVLVHASATAALVSGGLLQPAGIGSVLGWSLVLALAVQVLRSRYGRLRLLAVTAVAAAGLAAAALLLHLTGRLAPPVTMLTAVAASAVVREATESRQARRRADELLAGLARSRDAGEPRHRPAGAAERLSLVQQLQDEAVRDLDLRRALLEGLDEGVVFWDGAGVAVLSNPAAARLWGGPPLRSEMPGNGDPQIVQRDGRDLELRTTPLRDGLLGLIRDVTAERTLERRRREMQRLISHELRTPLGSLAGFGRMLQRYELDRDEVLRVATLICGEADRLSQTVSTFLDLERLDAGRPPGEVSRVDLAVVARGRLEVLAGAAAGRSQDLRWDDRGPAPVAGVATLLERVVDNLVGNAIKHPPPGTAIHVTVRCEGTDAVLEVSDDGPGISPDARSQIFERFYRAPGAAGGSGLGLALVRDVVTWHGGCITVDDRPGGGACFTVRLPLEDA